MALPQNSIFRIQNPRTQPDVQFWMQFACCALAMSDGAVWVILLPDSSGVQHAKGAKNSNEGLSFSLGCYAKSWTGLVFG